MNIYFSLLLAAAAAASLFAQQENLPPQDAAVCRAEQGLSSCVRRAQVFNSLALIPGEVSDFFVVTQLGQHLHRLAQSGMVPGFGLDSLSERILSVDNIAIASTAASSESYAVLSTLLRNYVHREQVEELSEWWTSHAADSPARVIDETVGAYTNRSAGAFEYATIAGGSSVHLPTCYIVVTFRPGEDADKNAHMLMEHVLSELRSGAEDWVSDVNHVNGFSGVRIDVEKLRQQMSRHNSVAALLHEAGVNRALYLMLRRQGNALVMALCENPQELRLAESPAESVLAGKIFDAFDAYLDKGFFYASHTSKELANVLQAGEADPLRLAPLLSDIFSKFDSEIPTESMAFNNASFAMTALEEMMQRVKRPTTQASTTQIWWDHDMHLRTSWDAMGDSYQPGIQRLASIAAAPSTIFYIESSPKTSAVSLPEPFELLDAGVQVLEGIALTLKPESKKNFTETLLMVRAFYPELQSLLSACATLREGLDGHVALVVDSCYATLPPCLTQGERVKTWFPRVAVYGGVSNRRNVSMSWDSLLKTSARIAGKLGADPECVHLLPIVPSRTGDVTCYKVALPIFSMDAVPNLAITDTELAVGTSCHLNTRLVTTSSGTLPLTGSVFTFKTFPLLDTLQSMAGVDKIAWNQRALKEACEAVQYFSKIVERIDGFTTIEEERYTLTVNVIFR